jgi:hypothetical protein
MSVPHIEQAKPTICLAMNDGVPSDWLAPVLLGMEEEGVPASVTRSAELDPLTLAAQAASSSRLGVGVGMSLDFVVVTTDKLPRERPYLAGRVTDQARCRVFGANAARLVRRVPLKLD